MSDNDHACQVFHFDLFGTRKEKYDFLDSHSLDDVAWTELHPQALQFFFVPKDFSLQVEYDKGFKVDELMKVNVSGIKTQRDDASVFMTEEEMQSMHSDFLALSVQELKDKYGFKDVRDWQVVSAKGDLQSNPILTNKVFYRPFDNRWMLYTGHTKGIQGYPRFDKMSHLIGKDNFALIVCKQQGTFDFQHAFISSLISDINSISLQSKEISYVFPLYLYPDDNQPVIDGNERVPNLNKEIWDKIENIVGQVTPEQIFDYIYGVLHTPSYRAKYKEFLKVDFPRIPYPTGKEEFDRIANIGTQLRKLHQMESVPTMPGIARFTTAGDNLVEKLTYKEGCVFFNDTQCFSNVPEEAWNFYIGGYQPAQKWLKDRKGRRLTFDDILHYRNIIVVLLETGRLMSELG